MYVCMCVFALLYEYIYSENKTFAIITKTKIIIIISIDHRHYDLHHILNPYRPQHQKPSPTEQPHYAQFNRNPSLYFAMQQHPNPIMLNIQCYLLIPPSVVGVLRKRWSKNQPPRIILNIQFFVSIMYMTFCHKKKKRKRKYLKKITHNLSAIIYVQKNSWNVCIYICICKSLYIIAEMLIILNMNSAILFVLLKSIKRTDVVGR